MKYMTFLKTLLLAPALMLSTSVLALGILESPADNSVQSGIGIFYGWHCDADKIELEIISDNEPLRIKPAAYGMTRKDTVGQCGDTDNGFGFVYAFNLLEAKKTYTVRALADGVEFDSAQFIVDYLDPAYIRDLASWVEVTVPALGKEAILVWQESTQGYVISDVQDLDFTMEDIINASVGNWAGTWQSAWTTGSTMAMGVEAVPIPGGATLQPTSVSINGTGCNAEAEQTTPITSLDNIVSQLVMKDGSEVEMQLLPVESMSAVSGIFVFDSGPCAELDGVFTLFKVVQ